MMSHNPAVRGTPYIDALYRHDWCEAHHGTRHTADGLQVKTEPGPYALEMMLLPDRVCQRCQMADIDVGSQAQSEAWTEEALWGVANAHSEDEEHRRPGTGLAAEAVWWAYVEMHVHGTSLKRVDVQAALFDCASCYMCPLLCVPDAERFGRAGSSAADGPDVSRRLSPPRRARVPLRAAAGVGCRLLSSALSPAG